MYAKLIDGALVYAPRKMNTEIEGEPYVVYNPPAEMLEADGWLPVVYTDEPGDAPEGWHCEPTYTEWQTETGQEIWQEWTLVQNEITEEIALTRYANKITGENDPDLTSAAETMITRFMEV